RDPTLYDAECRAVFAHTWQMVGRLDQLTEAGSFLTADLAGEPIAVVRDQQGVLRAFYNVCRHRAARVLEEECGKVSRLRCRYHGWTYDLAGRLRGTPEFEGVADFQREDNGLAPVAVAQWGPFVWAHLGTPGQPLEEFLAPLPDSPAARLTQGLRWHARRD